MNTIKSEQLTQKVLMILALFFFFGFALSTLLPDWQDVSGLKFVGIFIGYVLMISMIIFIYISVSAIKPYRTINNYLKVINIVIMIFIATSILSVNIIENEESQITIFVISGIVIIASTVYSYLVSKSLTTEKINSLWENNPKLHQEPIISEMDGIHLFSVYISIVIMLFIVSFDMAPIALYVLLTSINGYVLYKYLKVTNSSKNQTIVYSTISAVLLSVMIILFSAVIDVITVHVVVRVLITILPTIYVAPSILKNYYLISWKRSYDALQNVE